MNRTELSEFTKSELSVVKYKLLTVPSPGYTNHHIHMVCTPQNIKNKKSEGYDTNFGVENPRFYGTISSETEESEKKEFSVYSGLFLPPLTNS